MATTVIPYSTFATYVEYPIEIPTPDEPTLPIIIIIPSDPI